MVQYDAHLTDKARRLRRNLTDGEPALWSRLRKKPLLGIQFYRQKPIGAHIGDCFAPRAKLVVEVDGSPHLDGEHPLKDRSRDRYLVSLGLKGWRLNRRDVLEERDAVVEAIYRTVSDQFSAKIPPVPPLIIDKGGRRGKGLLS